MQSPKFDESGESWLANLDLTALVADDQDSKCSTPKLRHNIRISSSKAPISPEQTDSISFRERILLQLHMNTVLDTTVRRSILGHSSPSTESQIKLASQISQRDASNWLSLVGLPFRVKELLQQHRGISNLYGNDQSNYEFYS